MKRTQLFHSLGLFAFQSVSISQVQNHPCAINMSQHRQDKAQVVQELRKHRNKQRNTVKNSLNNDPLAVLSSNLNVFKKTAMDSIYNVVNGTNAMYFKTYFNTNDVPLTQRVSVYSLWLSLYLRW